MFEQATATIRQGIDGLEIPVSGTAIAESVALFDRFEYRILEAIGAFNAAGGWQDDDVTSMVVWLRNVTGRSERDAKRMVRTAKRLAELPVLAEVYRDGALSAGQVQAIVANLSDKTVGLFADQEAEIVPELVDLPVSDVAVAMQRWAQAAKDALQPDPAENPEPTVPERRLHLSRTFGGRRELSGSLDPEAGALTEAALRIAETDDVEGEPARTLAERRADALADILRYYLDHQNDHATNGRHRPHLNVFVDNDDLLDATSAHTGHDGVGSDTAWPMGPASPTGRSDDGAWPMGSAETGTGDTRSGRRSPRGGWLADGTQLDPATVARLACDCNLHRVLREGESSILDYGRAVRTAPPNLFNALVARDRTCRFPGCDRPAHWAEAHHVDWWEHGGETSIQNLVLVCSRHHHLLHLPGWHAKLEPDATLAITRPDGQIYRSRPPGRPPDLFSQPAA